MTGVRPPLSDTMPKDRFPRCPPPAACDRATADDPADAAAAPPQAAPDHGAPIFPYWTGTKTAIAICALKLAEQGRADLDACLPDHGVTLRQLLNHTAGLPDYATLDSYRQGGARDEEPRPREVLLGAAMRQGRLFPPGTGWAYSHIGYMLAREHIEAVSQRPFPVLFRALIGDVLGLQSIEPTTAREDFARVHWPAARRHHPGSVYHGCLTGTAADAARLLHGLFAGRLLGRGMLARMTRRHLLGGAIAGRPWTRGGYGIGLMIGRFGDAGRVIGHSGGGPFCVNAVYHFPDRPDPVTVACFADGTDEGRAEFAAARCA